MIKMVTWLILTYLKGKELSNIITLGYGKSECKEIKKGYKLRFNIINEVITFNNKNCLIFFDTNILRLKFKIRKIND